MQWIKLHADEYVTAGNEFLRGEPTGRIKIKRVQAGPHKGYWVVVVFMRAWGDFALYSPVIPVDVSREGVYFRTVTEAKRACKNINRVGMDHFIRGFV